MIHVIDNQAARTGQIIATRALSYRVQWSNFERETISKTAFTEKTKKADIPSVFNFNKRYIIVVI